MIKVMLCDDHALIRRGIRDTLSDASDIEVVGEAGDYGELRTLMRGQGCDVLVLDINLPGRSGLDALHVLKDEGTSVKVLIVSMYPEDQYAIRALRAGAHGYVNKGGDPQLLVQAVRTVAQGRKYVTPEIAQMLVESLSTPASEHPHEKLSDRELQTLVIIASGQMRLEHPPDRLVLHLGEATRNSAPHHPELVPNRSLAVEMDVLGQQLKRLLATPLVERVTETGPETIADEAIENPLVDGGSPPSFCAGKERPPEFAQQRHTPLLTRAECRLERFAEPFHFAGIDGARRGSVNAIDELPHLTKARRH
jgi:DNA-binding NarL/FixJ family response regulator